MGNLYINRGALNSVFDDLQNRLEGTLTTENANYKLDVNTRLAKGTIVGSNFNTGLSYLQFDIQFEEDTLLSIESSDTSPILFIYCTDGGLQHSFGVGNQRETIRSKQSAIIHNSSKVNSVLKFTGFQRIFFTVIISNVTHIDYRENSKLFDDLKKKFSRDNASFSFVGNQKNVIREKIQELSSVTQKGIIGDLLRKRLLLNVLELEVEQHSTGLKRLYLPLVRYVNRSIENVAKNTNDFIIKLLQYLGFLERSYVSKSYKDPFNF